MCALLSPVCTRYASPTPPRYEIATSGTGTLTRDVLNRSVILPHARPHIRWRAWPGPARNSPLESDVGDGVAPAARLPIQRIPAQDSAAGGHSLI